MATGQLDIFSQTILKMSQQTQRPLVVLEIGTTIDWTGKLLEKGMNNRYVHLGLHEVYVCKISLSIDAENEDEAIF